MKFSILISIYHKERAEYFDRCMQSIWDEQIMKPNEIILVQDGYLTEALYKIISQWKEKLGSQFKTIVLEENVGLGQALNEGLKHCSNNWIARMDTDDIAMPDRFEKQSCYLKNHPEIDVLGSWISEFDDSPQNTSGERTLPGTHHDIVQYAKYRNPINHMTVMFRKKAVKAVGGYLPMRGFEDYWLWIRMLKEGYVFANIEGVLVYARTGDSMLERRRGWRYIKDEINFEKNGWALGFFSFYDLLRNIIIRFVARLLPSTVLKKVYNALRK